MKLSTEVVNKINKEFNLKLKTIDSAQMDEFIAKIIKERIISVLKRLRKMEMINMAVEKDIIGNLTK